MRESVKRSALESYHLSPSFVNVEDVWIFPLWYNAQLTFTFTVGLIIEVSSGIICVTKAFL